MHTETVKVMIMSPIFFYAFRFRDDAGRWTSRHCSPRYGLHWANIKRNFSAFLQWLTTNKALRD